MKKQIFGTLILTVLIFLTGCDEKLLSELKTRNEELRIENASLKAQVNDLERNVKECDKKLKEESEQALKKLYKYTPQSNPNNNSNR